MSIDERPDVVERRNRVGDWEGDTVIGKRPKGEFSAHESIAGGLESNIYFAYPYASWERGINENTNGLIRQYFPKDTNFNEVTDEEVQFLMDYLNSRSRATRNFKSPNEMFLGQREDLLAA